MCIVDAAHDGVQCASGESKAFIPLEDADNYVCLSPSDSERLLKWAKLKCRK